MRGPSDVIDVLHVDDNPEITDLAATFLERKEDRMSVSTAGSPDEGLEMLTDRGVDCIVSDYDMPHTNGIEFLETVREQYPDLPFILFTGKGSEEVASDAIAAGVTDYLQKGSGVDQYTVLANRILNAVNAQRANLERRRHLNAIETAQEGISILDGNGHFIYVNERYAALYGYDPDEMIGNHLELIHPVADLQHIYEEVLPIVRETGYWHGTTTGLRADGTTFQQDHVLALTDTDELVCTVQDITERKERERELEETRARFEALTKNTTHAVVTIDDESTVQYANDAVEDVLGYPPEELVDESLLKIMPERFHEAHEAAVDRYLREGTKQLDWDWIELPGLHKNGHEVPLGISFGEATIDGERRFTALLRDVTDRKEREHELQRYEELIETLPIGYVRTTLDGEFRAMNSTFVAMVEGESQDDILTRDVEEFYQDPTTRESLLTALMEKGQVHNEELEVTTLSGETIWVLVTARIAGDERCIDALVQDITDRRRREGVLREMHDIISARDRTVEEQVRALLELGRTELDTQYGTLSEIRGDDYVFEIVAGGNDSVQAGDVIPVSATNCEIAASTEQTLVLGDIERDAPEETDRAGYTDLGISCYIGAPILIDDDVYGTFCFYGTEPRSGQFSEWEVTLVDLMSRWVSYELQRRQTNTRLQETNEQLEQFASIVSHDLRNPLNVAETRVALALEECDSEHLDHVIRAHDRMDALIDDLLTLALEGDQVGETAPIDPVTILETCWKNVDTRNATLRGDLERTFRADSGRLQELFENLIRNAIEHGGEDVTITVGDLDSGFYVEDDGPGIPEETRDDVFEAGYSTRKKGTGFGLRIVEQIVEAHGWDIHVTDSEDGGARFEISGVEIVR